MNETELKQANKLQREIDVIRQAIGIQNSGIGYYSPDVEILSEEEFAPVRNHIIGLMKAKLDKKIAEFEAIGKPDLLYPVCTPENLSHQQRETTPHVVFASGIQAGKTHAQEEHALTEARRLLTGTDMQVVSGSFMRTNDKLREIHKRHIAALQRQLAYIYSRLTGQPFDDGKMPGEMAMANAIKLGIDAGREPIQVAPNIDETNGTLMESDQHVPGTPITRSEVDKLQNELESLRSILEAERAQHARELSSTVNRMNKATEGTMREMAIIRNDLTHVMGDCPVIAAIAKNRGNATHAAIQHVIARMTTAEDEIRRRQNPAGPVDFNGARQLIIAIRAKVRTFLELNRMGYDYESPESALEGLVVRHVEGGYAAPSGASDDARDRAHTKDAENLQAMIIDLYFAATGCTIAAKDIGDFASMMNAAQAVFDEREKLIVELRTASEALRIACEIADIAKANADKAIKEAGEIRAERDELKSNALQIVSAVIGKEAPGGCLASITLHETLRYVKEPRQKLCALWEAFSDHLFDYGKLPGVRDMISQVQLLRADRDSRARWIATMNDILGMAEGDNRNPHDLAKRLMTFREELYLELTGKNSFADSEDLIEAARELKSKVDEIERLRADVHLNNAFRHDLFFLLTGKRDENPGRAEVENAVRDIVAERDNFKAELEKQRNQITVTLKNLFTPEDIKAFADKIREELGLPPEEPPKTFTGE